MVHLAKSAVVFLTMALLIGHLVHSRRWPSLLKVGGDVGSDERSVDSQKASDSRLLASDKSLGPTWETIKEQTGEAQLKDGSGFVFSCKDLSKMDLSPESTYLAGAVDGMCKRPEYANQFDTWVDPDFQQNYKKLYGKTGWLDEAYVAYFSLAQDDARQAVQKDTQLTWLVKSVHQSSAKPIVAFNFGATSTSLDPEEFPRAVIMKARPMHPNAHFQFNKFRAMLLSKVRTGIMLETDVLVAPAADQLFPRIKEEITEEYPYPILPTHWLSRDDDPNFPDHPYSVYDFKCKHCPMRSQRWNQGNPTFTYHSLPFLAQWLRKTLDHEYVGGESLQGKTEEDVFNMALWDAQATKQWCKFDVPFENEFHQYMNRETGLDSYRDPKWYPDGIPIVFYTAHQFTDFDQDAKLLQQLESHSTTGAAVSGADLAMSSSSLEVQARDNQLTAPRRKPVNGSATPMSTTSMLAMLNGSKLKTAGLHINNKIDNSAKDAGEAPVMDSKAASGLPPPIYFKDKYYNSGKELFQDHPKLRCII